MAHNYSKGPQSVGDIKGADDSNKDTLIDFEEDRIDLKTAGATRFKISGSNGEITFNEEYTFPISDGSNGQVLKTNGSGDLTWQNESGDLTAVQALNTITNATGDVPHNCTNSNIFYHSTITANFTPNFTQLGMENNQTTDVALILSQGGTGYLPEAFKVNSTSSTLFWEGTSMPTASINKTDTVNLRIIRMSDTYSTFAKFSKTIQITVSSGVTIPSNALMFLDASNASSYGGSGTTWTDLSGQNKHGTLINSPTYNNTDKLFEFSGNSSQHITVPSGFNDFSNGVTFFVVADLGVGNNWERFLDFSVGGQTNHAFNFGRKQTNTNLSLQYYTVTEGGNKTLESNQISNNTLASYAVTTDGTNAKIYKNGSLVQTISFAATLSNTTRTQNYIGRSRAGGNAYYEGDIGVVGIFNRDLSASEITALHNAYATIYSL